MNLKLILWIVNFLNELNQKNDNEVNQLIVFHRECFYEYYI